MNARLALTSPTAEEHNFGQRYHPDFSENGDLCFASKDGNTLFRTDSSILKRTSGFFKDACSLKERGAEDSTEDFEDTPITTPYSAEVLEHILKMVSGLEILPLTMDTVNPVIEAAEGWTMPGPLSIIRLATRSAPLVDHPLEMYVICRRQGWTEELQYFAKQSLQFNLLDRKYHDTLKKLSGSALLDLLTLHRNRREILREKLSKSPFLSGAPSTCNLCQGVIHYSAWRELRYKIILEMDANPSGISVATGLSDWEEAQACWAAMCPNGTCRRKLYDKAESCKAILEVVRALPDRVEDTEVQS